MTGVSVVRGNSRRGLAVVACLLAAGAGAQPPAGDLTGIYKKEGGELAIIQGDNESFAYYSAAFPQGQSAGTCECPLALKQKTAAAWTLQGEAPADVWTLKVGPQKLTLDAKAPSCCGMGFPGAGAFARTSVAPLKSCKVKAPRASFHAMDAGNTQRKAFVVAGDTVQAYVPDTEPPFVPARFVGPKKSTAGQLKLAELDCAATGASAPASQPAPVDAKALAGKWTQVERAGKGYVINKACDSDNPYVEIKPNGDMTIGYGQDDEEGKLSGLKPNAAAGAYSLEFTSKDGPKRTLEWTVVDAKKELVRLKGSSAEADFFKDGPLFVKDAKKAGIPTKKEKCDHYMDH